MQQHNMNNRLFTALAAIILHLTGTLSLCAQNWDHIRTSGEYYYGIGTGADLQVATSMAVNELSSSIATHVSSTFDQRYISKDSNGKLDYTEVVASCVKTYSQSSLTNLKTWVVDGSKNNEVRVYVERSEVKKMFDQRVEKAKDMIQMAGEELESGHIDMALEYYYWAYCLVRAVQYPNTIKDSKGHILVNWLQKQINDILSGVTVKYDRREGDEVDLFFYYKDKPVSSLIFTYNDGRQWCEGTAKDGRGMIEMAPGYQTDTYHIAVEYEFKGQTLGDAEMRTIMQSIVKENFLHVEHHILAKEVPGKASDEPKIDTRLAGVKLAPSQAMIQTESSDCAEILAKVTEAIRTRNYVSAERYFTVDGRNRFRTLVRYGTGRIVGTPNVVFFKSANGNTVARGMQMAFTFGGKVKKTFVEDVVFTFDKDKRIDNVAFGLGQVAENDILCRENKWHPGTREMLMEFLENYKTAYCMKDSNYISTVFADDAVIIVGKVARVNRSSQVGERPVSLEGQQTITYNKYDKQTYLKNLKRTFQRNEFINIRFTNNDIQWLEKYKDEELYAIQIGQEYSSSTYADKGYLFLLVNMTDHDNPQIKIRTWQPNEIDKESIYHSGHFYNE